MNLKIKKVLYMKKLQRAVFYFSGIVLVLSILGCSFSMQSDIAQTDVGNKKLTLIIYMAGDNDLESYAIENLKSMEHAKFRNINVLALVDRAEGYDETNGNWTDTRLLKITHDKTEGNYLTSERLDCPPLGISADKETELDMGNYLVLQKLLKFAETEFKSEQYALIIWGHGTGWRYEKVLKTEKSRAVAIDDKTDSFMSVSELGKALQNSHLGVIGFDTCFGGVIENVYELKDCAEFTVASPGVTPASGWNYKYLLERLSECDFSAETIAEIMKESSSARTTKIKNSEVQELKENIEEFSKNLSARIENTEDKDFVLKKIFNSKSYSYNVYPCDMYLDVYSLAECFVSDESNDLSASAKKLCNAVNNAAVTSYSENSEIGIYFISKTSSNTVSSSHPVEYLKSQTDAGQCKFIKESNWWVPTEGGNSESVLDKLFYMAE